MESREMLSSVAGVLSRSYYPRRAFWTDWDESSAADDKGARLRVWITADDSVSHGYQLSIQHDRPGFGADLRKMDDGGYLSLVATFGGPSVDSPDVAAAWIAGLVEGLENPL